MSKSDDESTFAKAVNITFSNLPAVERSPILSAMQTIRSPLLASIASETYSDLHKLGGEVTPSTKDGLSKSTERQLKQAHIRLIFTAGLLLELPIAATCRAADFFHVFYTNLSLTRYNPIDSAQACLLLASKVASSKARRVRDVFTVFFHLCHSISPLDIALPSNATYWLAKQRVIRCEHVLLRLLQFKTSIFTPHDYLFHFARELELSRAVVALAFAIANDSYSYPFCVIYPSEAIATASLKAAYEITRTLEPSNFVSMASTVRPDDASLTSDNNDMVHSTTFGRGATQMNLNNTIPLITKEMSGSSETTNYPSTQLFQRSHSYETHTGINTQFDKQEPLVSSSSRIRDDKTRQAISQEFTNNVQWDRFGTDMTTIESICSLLLCMYDEAMRDYEGYYQLQRHLLANHVLSQAKKGESSPGPPSLSTNAISDQSTENTIEQMLKHPFISLMPRIRPELPKRRKASTNEGERTSEKQIKACALQVREKSWQQVREAGQYAIRHRNEMNDGSINVGVSNNEGETIPHTKCITDIVLSVRQVNPRVTFENPTSAIATSLGQEAQVKTHFWSASPAIPNVLGSESITKTSNSLDNASIEEEPSNAVLQSDCLRTTASLPVKVPIIRSQDAVFRPAHVFKQIADRTYRPSTLISLALPAARLLLPEGLSDLEQNANPETSSLSQSSNIHRRLMSLPKITLMGSLNQDTKAYSAPNSSSFHPYESTREKKALDAHLQNGAFGTGDGSDDEIEILSVERKTSPFKSIGMLSDSVSNNCSSEDEFSEYSDDSRRLSRSRSRGRSRGSSDSNYNSGRYDGSGNLSETSKNHEDNSYDRYGTDTTQFSRNQSRISRRSAKEGKDDSYSESPNRNRSSDLGRSVSRSRSRSRSRSSSRNYNQRTDMLSRSRSRSNGSMHSFSRSFSRSRSKSPMGNDSFEYQWSEGQPTKERLLEAYDRRNDLTSMQSSSSFSKISPLNNMSDAGQSHMDLPTNSHDQSVVESQTSGDSRVSFIPSPSDDFSLAFQQSSSNSFAQNSRIGFGIENRRTSSGPGTFSSFGRFAAENLNAALQTPRSDMVDPSALAAAEAAAAITDHFGEDT